MNLPVKWFLLINSSVNLTYAPLKKNLNESFWNLLENILWTALLLMVIIWNTDCFVSFTLQNFNAAVGALSISYEKLYRKSSYGDLLATLFPIG